MAGKRRVKLEVETKRKKRGIRREETCVKGREKKGREGRDGRGEGMGEKEQRLGDER